MNRDTIYRLTAIFMITLLNLLPGPAAAEAPSGGQGLDTARIERLTGVKGKLDEKEGVFKVSQPRADLRVTAAGVKMTPPLGLTSWAAFMKAGGRTLVMGDMVLLEDQVNPVMSVALDNGLEITALHNHFFWDSPRMFFMHVHARGTLADLVSRVEPVVAMIGGAPVVGPAAPAEGLDVEALAAIVGHPGTGSGAVFKITIGRPDIDLREHGARIGSRMGLNTWAAFTGSDRQAMVAGDVAMLASEVTPVLQALRSHGIFIVALHHHMVGTDPAVYFVHYWGRGTAEELARAVRAALDVIGG